MAYGIGVPHQQASLGPEPTLSSTASRRAVLLAGVLAPLSACAVLDEAAAEPPSPPDPDLQLRHLVADAERDLIARYQATVDSHPDLTDSLSEFVARHERHLAAVLDTAPEDRPLAARRAGDDLIGAIEVPSGAADAVDALRTAERNGSAERLLDCVAAADYELARVVASIAACETAHDRLLRGVG